MGRPMAGHDPDRTAVRYGRERGSVILGGRRVPITRPGAEVDGSGELPNRQFDPAPGADGDGEDAGRGVESAQRHWRLVTPIQKY